MSGRAPRYDAWLVDLDGTLYRAAPVKVAMLVELATGGWGAASVLRRFRHEHEAIRRDPAGIDDSFSAQLERTAAATGLDRVRLESMVTEWMVRRPGKYLRMFRRESLISEIVEFRRLGGKTAVVSDYPATEKLAALGARDLFDVVVSNGEHGHPLRLKPDPMGYLRAASELGVAPDRSLVIGDRLDADGEAAQRAGMAFRSV
jgi:HAD superfamily hydrolase (TIGR01549 family)